MESVLIAGLASAFVLSVLEYWVDGPVVRAVAGISTAAVAVILTAPIGMSTIPEILAATFLAAFAVNLAARSELRGAGRRL